LEQLDVDEGEDDIQNAQIEDIVPANSDEFANILNDRNNVDFAMSMIVQKDKK
jgi:hypothetical protein